MAELEVSVFLTVENAQTKSSFFTGKGFLAEYQLYLTEIFQKTRTFLSKYSGF